MTSYHGGKQRIGKELADIIHKESIDINIKGYCEPFCGMLGVYQHISSRFSNEIHYKAGDINESVIKMWCASQNGWEPPTSCNKQKFFELKNNGESTAEKGFVGHLWSFRSIYFGGYADHITTNRIKNTANKVKKIATDLKEVEFTYGSYDQFSKLKGYVIYCDPPYTDTRQNYTDENGHIVGFDTEKFWEWCSMMSENNIVFVSEYNQISNARLIYSNKKEKLFLIKRKKIRR